MSEQPNLVSLNGTDLCACIDPHGAQLSQLQDRAGRNLLWNGTPSIWSGRAPILFPIVGMLVDGRYRVGAKTYQLPRHGFARNTPFALATSCATKARFELTADANTLQVYPFKFQLDIEFELIAATLSLNARISNKGNEPMPASFGWHPGLCWPLPFGQSRASHFIEFEYDEPEGMRRIDSAGLLRAERYPTPIAQRRMHLTDELFRDDAIIFDRLKSRAVTYGSSSGPRLRLEFPDTPYLGIWTKPGAQFICIEPWHGVTDPQGFSGDFQDKPGVFMVRPGASMTASVTITLLE
jgi:galactose mutarotase-like enzyme